MDRVARHGGRWSSSRTCPGFGVLLIAGIPSMTTALPGSAGCEDARRDPGLRISDWLEPVRACDTIAGMQSAREYFDYLNHAYAAVHKAKEDLFWATYMATSSDQAGFVRAEGAYKEFIGDPARLTKTRRNSPRSAPLRRAPNATRCCMASAAGWRSSRPTSSTARKAGRSCA